MYSNRVTMTIVTAIRAVSSRYTGSARLRMRRRSVGFVNMRRGSGEVLMASSPIASYVFIDCAAEGGFLPELQTVAQSPRVEHD
jgi:hypothetical protein